MRSDPTRAVVTTLWPASAAVLYAAAGPIRRYIDKLTDMDYLSKMESRVTDFRPRLGLPAPNQPDHERVSFIAADTVRRLTPMPGLVAALGAAFAEFRGGAASTRQAYRLNNDVSMLVMAAQDRRVAGVKVVTVNPEARPAVTGLYLLIDAANGRLLNTIDASALTPRRTAAASALASEFLSRRDASHLVMIGTGTLAPHLVEAHSSVRDIGQVTIWGRDKSKAAALAADLRRAGYPATSDSDLEHTVRCADIVSVATLAREALVKGEWLRPGTHLDLVGAFTPDMCEADPECFRRGTVFVDAREAALEEAGDLLRAIEAGALSRADIAGDLSDLCAARVPGREDDRAITLFKSVGLALEDLVAADFIHQGIGDAQT